MPYKDKEKENECRRRMYRRRMDAIMSALGTCCAICGSTTDLHIDHINGRPYTSRKISSNQRIVMYEKELKEGKLRLLCESCNCSSKNHPPGCTCGRKNQPHPPPPAKVREPGEDDDEPIMNGGSRVEGS